MQPQCTAVVDNPLTAGVESNGTGGYQHIYKGLNTGDSLAKEYADDTAAAPKNRRAGVMHDTRHGRCCYDVSVAACAQSQLRRESLMQHCIVSL